MRQSVISHPPGFIENHRLFLSVYTQYTHSHIPESKQIRVVE